MPAKRARGDGSIFERKVEGKAVGWTASLELGYVNGRRRRKVFRGATREVVRDKLDDARRALKGGTLAKAGRLTTGEWLSRWLEDVARPRTRPSTYRTYKLFVERHLIPELGKIPLERLTPTHVRELFRHKADLSPVTVGHIRSILRNALGVALEDELVTRNVAAIAHPPRVPHREMKVLTPEQAGLFLEACRGDRLEAVYVTALALGLRQGEVLGLRWRDIDIQARTLRVVGALQRIDGEFHLVEPKSATSRRVVDLPQVVVNALAVHRDRQDAERAALDGRWLDSMGLVFTTSFGAPLNGTTVTHWLHAILDRAQLPSIRFHDLRHSCASLLLAQGVPARMVMETLGHSQISLTLGTYGHIFPSLRKETATAIDKALSR